MTSLTYTQAQLDILLSGKATPAQITAAVAALTKSSVGLANVDNTADSAKPVSTAQAAAISAAINGLVNGAPGALDTLNELGAALGNDANFGTTITNALALKAPLASPAFTGTPTGITKAHVGLGNVDNTADTAKPVSTAQAAAIGTKLDALTTPVTLTTSGPLTAGAWNLLDATSGPLTATLPTPTKIGQRLIAERQDAGTNLISFAGTIRGVTTGLPTFPGVGVRGESIDFEAESLTSWRIIASHKPKALLDKQFDALGAAAAAAAITSGTSARLRALGDNPVMTSPLTITSQTAGGKITDATSTVTGTLLTPEWLPSTVYPSGATVLHPTDQKTVIRRTTAGTSRSTYDTTEQALWTSLTDGAIVTYPIRYTAAFLRQRSLNASNEYGPRQPKRTDASEETDAIFESLWAIEFDWYTVAGALEIPTYDKCQLRFVVDGQYVSLTPTQIGSNNYSWQNVKLSGASAGTHRVRVEIGGPWSCIGGVRIATADFVTPTSYPVTKTFMVVGDSIANGYTGTAGSGSASPDVRGYSARTARLLGFDTYTASATAATGFTTVARNNYGARLQDVINAQPDYLYIAGTSNDIANAASTLPAAAQSFYAAVKAGCPNTKIVAAGAINIAGATDTVTPVLKAAAAAAGVTFLDTTDWNVLRAPAMNVDSTHPTVAGHDYLANRLAPALAAIWGLPF